MNAQNNDSASIDYQTLIQDIRHELEKCYRLNMHPAWVLDTIDILIHEQTGLACVADTIERGDSGKDSLPAKCDFIVLACNRQDQKPGFPVESWAYEGNLDFHTAKPPAYGCGKDVQESLMALREHIDLPSPIIKKAKGLHIDLPPSDHWRVVYLIDLNAPDALTAAEMAHVMMVDPDSLRPVLQVLDSKGKSVTYDLANHPPESCRWHCPRCKKIEYGDYHDLATSAAPYCNDCDCEMRRL